MKRLQQSTNTSTITNTSANVSTEISSAVPVKRTRVTSTEKEPRELENDDNALQLRTRSKNPSEIQTDAEAEDQIDMSTNTNTNTNDKPSRLQQRPAYISVNLMKIKMECDYNPVVRLKRELTQHLNPEIGQSNAVNVNDNDNHKEKEEHEIEYPIICIDDSPDEASDSEAEQQEQDKAATRVEADVDNAISMETRESQNKQKEKERVEKLGEEIVISLAREKTEIPTSLQNKIDQLNLVNGQQQTNINALNSIITQQWTEINQLKPQVTEHQKQNEELRKKLKSSATIENQQSTEIISDLNSKIALGKDENKELKSQVAEQKKQIEELSNKLKSSATSENQKLAEIHDLNSKIARQRDENKELKSQIEDLNKQLKSRNKNPQSTEMINDLNSKITFQQDQNQELKSQVAKHKSEIAKLKDVFKSRAKNQQSTEIQNLYSTISLKQNENQRLKSQVAEQEKQIEELNQNLTSMAENENLIPTANLQHCAKNSNFTFQTEPNQNQGPLQISDLPTNVRSHIFDYLDLNSVKDSRFVCRRWREEAGKILLQNFYLVCDDEKRCTKSLKNWLTNSYSNSMAIAEKLLAKEGEITLGRLKHISRLKCSIKELKCSQLDTQDLYDILNKLPNLQVLETKALDLSPQQNWLGPCPKFYTANHFKLQLIVQKLKTLNKLTLDFCMSQEAATHFLCYRQQLASVKSMEIHAGGVHFISSFMNYSFCKLNITRFTLDIEENYSVELIRSFLLRISPSLKHLKFTVKSLENDALSSSRFEPWTDDWLIPLGLNRVETLEIVEADDAEKFIVKSILSAFQLPRLKKLAVDFIPEELEKVVHKWNSHESANGRKLESESLEELEIFSQFPISAPSIIYERPRQLWPNLKSLKYAWNSPHQFDASFLRKLESLERLELKMWERNPDKSINVTTNYSVDHNKFRLRDLTNLKSICLKFPENDKRSQKFTACMIQSDLKYMKSLKFVQFHRVVVDVGILKSSLGPNAPAIIFTT